MDSMLLSYGTSYINNLPFFLQENYRNEDLPCLPYASGLGPLDCNSHHPYIDGVACTWWWRGGAGSSESAPRETTPTYPVSAASGEKSPRRRGRGQSAKPDQMAGSTQFPARRRSAPEHIPSPTIIQPCGWGGSPVGGKGKGRSASPGRPFSPQAELSSKTRWGYTTTTTPSTV